MGHAIGIHHQAIDDILKALKIDHLSKLTSIEFRVDCNGPASLHINRLLEDEEAKSIADIFEMYQLHGELIMEKQEEK